MKNIKTLVLMFVVTMLTINVNGQTGTSKNTTVKPATTSTTTQSTTKTVVKKGETKPATAKPNASTNSTAREDVKTTTTETKTVRKNADGRTKTGDKINKEKKGPNGETVYTGPKDGNYYLDKKENKVYIK